MLAWIRRVFLGIGSYERETRLRLKPNGHGTATKFKKERSLRKG